MLLSYGLPPEHQWLLLLLTWWQVPPGTWAWRILMLLLPVAESWGWLPLLPCLQSLTFSACLGSAMPPSPVLATVFINRFQDCIQYFNSRYWISEVLWLVGQRLTSVYLTWWANRYAPHSQVLRSVQLGFVLLSNNSTPWWVSLWKQGFLLSLEQKKLMA